MPTKEQRRALFSGVRERVVAIVAMDFSEARSMRQGVRVLGSGFLARPDGLVVTAKHVLEKLDEFVASTSWRSPLKSLLRTGVDSTGAYSHHMCSFGRTYSDPHRDVAVIAPSPWPHPWAEVTGLGIATERVREGDEMALCGYPFGEDLGRVVSEKMPIDFVLPSFATGSVSAVHPFPNAASVDLRQFQWYAVISHGLSGGPVFDVETGEVCGVQSGSVFATNRTPDGQVTAPVTRGLSTAEHAEHVGETLMAARRAFSA